MKPDYIFLYIRIRLRNKFEVNGYLNGMSEISRPKIVLARKRVGRVRRVKTLGYIIPIEGGEAAGKSKD